MLGARELPLQELYTDTRGASDHVFGLCHMLGFRFVPRMRDLALRKLGRIERTLFTLDWLEQPALRRACQAGLNKGEARHALADAIYTNRQGRFTDRSLENQQNRASGLNLLIAAIAYWNTLYLGRAADHLRYSGVEIDEALLAHVSPLGWSHIGPTGDYLWEDASSHRDGGYRALHDARPICEQLLVNFSWRAARTTRRRGDRYMRRTPADSVRKR
jgi:hypothetical protein